MGVEGYVEGLVGSGDKRWGEEIEECGGVVCLVLEEKKKEGLKKRDGEGWYDESC